MQKITSQKGSVVKWILILVVLLLGLSYLGFDLKSFTESDSVQGNFSFAWDFILDIWNTYLKEHVIFIWDYIEPLFSKLLEPAAGSENILELLENIELPEAGSIVPLNVVPIPIVEV